MRLSLNRLSLQPWTKNETNFIASKQAHSCLTYSLPTRDPAFGIGSLSESDYFALSNSSIRSLNFRRRLISHLELGVLTIFEAV